MESTKPALKRKRRPVGECPNPLFVKWVEEWRDEAREEGSKVQYAYTRALNSLKKYPLPLVSGQEAKILDHIGEKLAKKLDKKLAQYRASEGENSDHVKRSKMSTSRDRETCWSPERQTTKGRRKRAQTEYVPEYRSGPYAIIIALYQAKQSPSWMGHLTKNQLISQAQPFSDKSFTIPDDGKYYTAWSSTATLIRKGLVDKRGCPAKFRLTEAGEEMAERLERATSSLPSTSSLSLPPNPSSPSPSSSTSRELNRPSKAMRVSPPQWSQTQGPLSPPSPPLSLKSPNNSAPVCLAVSEGPTISLVSDSDEGSSSDVEILPPLAARIGRRQTTPSLKPGSPASSQRRKGLEKTPEQAERGGAGRGGGREPVTPAQMAGRAALQRLHTGASSSGGERERASWSSRGVDLTLEKEDSPVRKKQRQSDDEEFPDFPLLSKRKPGLNSRAHHTTPTSPTAKCHRSPTLSPPSPSPSLPKSTGRSALRDITTSTAHSPSSSNITNKKASRAAAAGPPLFRLRPGEFEVILCVDSAESTACRKSSSQFRGILLQELAKNGVKFDVRKLNVGDFLWIAREKSSPLPGQLALPRTREVVLEYIVERKRMDDLAGSITDGRFHEQKFRMSHCGVRQAMYLVEEFSDKMHLKLPLRSLEQAISNTQVIDGFTVHRTADVRESVAYLTLFTRQLCTHYSRKTLEAFPWDTIAELNKPPQQSPAGMTGAAHHHHLTEGGTVLGVEFASFNEASVKNKALTAYEMLGRQLMQVPCVSAERAAAILDHFPTISALREAYRHCGSTSEREALVSSLKAGQSRSLGKNIGNIMCSLYYGK